MWYIFRRKGGRPLQKCVRMCNPKYFSQDKIKDMVCGEGVGCMMSSREEILEIH